MTIAKTYAEATDTKWQDAARAAHAKYDKTRCAGWLAATGNRPIGGVSEVTLYKNAVPVAKVRPPMPAYACDIHPVEP